MTMHVYGPAHLHAAQPLNSPHRPAAAPPPQATHVGLGADQVDISPEADFVSQVRDLPEIRADRVAQIKAQIQAGTYETDEKLDIAISRLLDEIA
jgi:negative regulator of flagellin synthesis FlgM